MNPPEVGVSSEPAAIDLYWLPLGAGGWFVRFNGRVYEAFRARRESRPSLELYHTALIVTLPEGRFVIENAWPIPDGNRIRRGVTIEGPVWHRRLERFRSFRYEVRCWRDGTIADIAYAIASPQRASSDATQARRVLDLARRVPAFVWGRRLQGDDEMWNSNSVIAWLLTRAGVPLNHIDPPLGGRAPGWETGVRIARASTNSEDAAA